MTKMALEMRAPISNVSSTVSSQSTQHASHENKVLPFHLQFIAGGIAGISEILVMYPLDVVKTRFQLQIGKGIDGHPSIFGSLKNIVQQEGVTRLYRGILAPILIEAPKRAIKFAANEQYTILYKKLSGQNKVNQKMSIISGMGAGITEAFIICGFELVKIRMQDKNNSGRYKNTFDAVIKIVREEGPLSFYKGLESTLWRHAAWNGTYFGSIHGIRSSLPEAHTHRGKLLRNFVAGAIGGTLATTFNTPFDVVKTRVQNQLPGIIPKYGWTWPAIFTIIREEGFTALYKGYLPKVLRLGPGGGILLVVYEQVSSWMKKHLL